MTFKIENRRALFDYEIITKYVAGIVLSGDEVKSIRAGNASIADAYGFVKKNEIFITNMNITPYALRANRSEQEKSHATRSRKLLLKRSEIQKIIGAVSRKNYTLIPLSGFFGQRGFFKICIALAKHKKTFDKKEDIKMKDLERDLRRQLKNS